MKIFVLIVNYNAKDLIVKCLNSLRRIRTPFQIVVVDNGSTDRSVSSIKRDFPNVTIIENKRNIGFAAGNNLGIKYALQREASHVLLLNPDTEVENNFILPLVKNGADIVAPVIKFKRNGRIIFDLGGYVNFWIGRTQHLEVNDKENIKPYSPDYVSAASVLIRGEVFKEIGFFDQRFFLYFEDTDFCLRAKRSGFALAVEPRSVVFHKLREGKIKPIFQNLHLLRSNLIFINKHVPVWRRPVAWLYWILISAKILFDYLPV